MFRALFIFSLLVEVSSFNFRKVNSTNYESNLHKSQEFGNTIEEQLRKADCESADSTHPALFAGLNIYRHLIALI